uniref:T-cell receptor alpha/delta variable 5.0.1 n=1 Tax=Sinocyclocheilus grahami TaxID=75366 RepID=A0A672PZW5_SINGR
TTSFLITTVNLVSQDGNSVTLSCNYTGAVYNLLWYRQYQRSKPELLLSMTESGDPVKEDPSAHWLSAKVDKHTKLMELEISPAKVSDSAHYYCALRPTVTGNPFPLYIIFLYICHAFNQCLTNTYLLVTVLLCPAVIKNNIPDPNRSSSFTSSRKEL